MDRWKTVQTQIAQIGEQMSRADLVSEVSFSGKCKGACNEAAALGDCRRIRQHDSLAGDRTADAQQDLKDFPGAAVALDRS